MKSQSAKLTRLVRFFRLRGTKGFTNEEVAEYTGMAYQSVARMTREMHLQKDIYISGHRPPTKTGPWRRVYAFGSHPDASPPPPLTKSQRDARSFHRKRTTELAAGVLG